MDASIDREHAWRWRDAALGEVEFLSARYVTHSFAPHTHDGYAFGVVEDGAEAFWYSGATRIALPGQLIALNPGELHTGASAPGAGGWVYRMIYPSADLVMQAAETAGPRFGTPTFRSPVIDDSEISAAVAAYHRAVESRRGALAEASGLLDVLALIVSRHAAEAGPTRRQSRNDRAANQAREFIEAHFRRNVTLKELSAVAGVSPFHLARVFRAVHGIPPHRYLEQRRVREAQGLLRTGASLSFAAAEAGFTDQSQLTHHFKRHFGVTPGSYRRAMVSPRASSGAMPAAE